MSLKVESYSCDESESCAAVNFTAKSLSTEKAIQTNLHQNHLENELTDLRTEKRNLSKKLDLDLFTFFNVLKDEVHFRATRCFQIYVFFRTCGTREKI